MRISHPLTTLLCVFTLIGAGCGKPVIDVNNLSAPIEEPAQPQAEGAQREAQEPAADKNTTENGDTIMRGRNLTIPPTFPSDVPIYPGAEVTAVTHVLAADAASVLLTTNARPTVVAAWYDAQTAADWKVTASVSGTQRETRRYEKPGYDLNVTIELKESLTNITVVRVKKPST